METEVKFTKELIDSIKVIYCDPDPGHLWGIPYEMRDGQSPTDLWRGRTLPDPTRPKYEGWTIPAPGPLEGWVWIPPEWRRDNLTEEERKLIKDFIEPMKEKGWIPTRHQEWMRVEEYKDAQNSVQS